MRSDKKSPLKSDKKVPPKVQKKGSLGYNKKSALLEDAITQMNAGKYARASAALKDLLALDPLNAEARRLFATLHLRLGSLMSARAAFESLAREAMERQDYWLAESLLREYLTAGPRCVPFLEMLGHVYEDKGDVMAAVAEYGKAVEVLLEDPDSDHPNHAGDLFAKIRAIAPGSPVAFRFAAMFDAVTGQLLQPTTLAGSVAPADDSVTEPAKEPIVEAVAEPSSAVEAMGMDVATPIFEPPPSLSVQDEALPEPLPSAIVEEPSPTPIAEMQPVIQESAPVLDVVDVAPPSMPEPEPVALRAEPIAICSVPEITLVAESTVEPPSPLTLAGPEHHAQPIVEVVAEPNPAPMPWDQMQGPPPVQEPVAEPPSVVEAMPEEPAVVAEPVALSVVEQTAVIEPIGEAPVLEPAPTEPSMPTVAEAVETPAMSSEPVPSVEEAPVLTIEVLRDTHSHPIATAPAGPAPMPWDQVPESMEVVSPTEEAPAIEPEAVTPEPVADPTPDPMPASTPTLAATPTTEDGFTSSSGLSWKDILAAVSEMQGASAPSTAVPTAEGAVTPPAAEAPVVETTSHAASPADLIEATPASPVSPFAAATTTPITDAPPISAPMPWEQVEVHAVEIPQPDPTPEPEAEATLVEAMVGAEVAVETLPTVADVPEAVAPEMVVAPVEVPVPLAEPEMSLQTAELPVETPAEPTPLSISTELSLRVEEPEAVASMEPELPVASSVETSIEPSFRLAGAEPAPSESVDIVDIPEPMPEPMIAALSVVEEPAPRQEEIVESVPPIAEAVMVEAVPALSSESPVDVEPVEAVVEPPAEAPALSAVEVEPPIEIEIEAAAPPEIIEPMPVAEEPVNAIEIPIVEPPAPAYEEPPPVEAVTDAPLMDALAPVEPAMDLQSIKEPAPAEAVMPSEPPQEPVVVPQPASEGELRILWEEGSKAPVSASSTGNMFSRWLRKPAEAAPPTQPEPPVAAPVEPEPPAAVAQQPEITLEPAAPAPLAPSPASEPPVSPAPFSMESAPVHHPVPKAPARSAWGTIGRGASSVIGAGVSTTRSIVVLGIGLVGASVMLALGTVGLLALTWSMLDEQPNTAYRAMTSVPQQTVQDSQKNGYFLLLGFGASPSQDPMQVGMERRADESDRALMQVCLSGEGAGVGSPQGASAETTAKWLKTSDPAAQMRQGAASVKAWTAQAETAMGRYRQWLTKSFDDRGYGQAISPNCGAILQAHRLYVADGFAQDVDTGLMRVETDLTAWRAVLAQARTLPIKMLASDALTDDLAVVSGLLLRPELDERQISRLAKLVRPLDSAEQSMKWPTQSHFVLATKSLDAALATDHAESRPFYAGVAAALPLPKQRRFNAYAQYYEEAGKAAADGHYTEVPKPAQFVRTPPFGMTDWLMNPIESVVGLAPLPTWELYAGRVMDTEARMRLASLQAWLRRTPADQDLPVRVAKAGQGFYDPFTGLPMLMNTKKGLLYSVGRDLKDDDGQEPSDVAVQIPPSAWIGGKRAADAGEGSSLVLTAFTLPLERKS